MLVNRFIAKQKHTATYLQITVLDNFYVRFMINDFSERNRVTYYFQGVKFSLANIENVKQIILVLHKRLKNNETQY